MNLNRREFLKYIVAATVVPMLGDFAPQSNTDQFGGWLPSAGYDPLRDFLALKNYSEGRYGRQESPTLFMSQDVRDTIVAKISPNIPLVPSNFNWEKLAEILEFCRRQSAAPTMADAWKFHAALNL